MKNYILIGLGGSLGAIARYLVEGLHIIGYTGKFPLNTLIINITGSFILALFLTFALELWKLDESIRLGFATGCMGAFTTFSTLCKETVLLLKEGSYIYAFSYMGFSIILGMFLAYLGVVLSKWIIRKYNV